MADLKPQVEYKLPVILADALSAVEAVEDQILTWCFRSFLESRCAPSSTRSPSWSWQTSTSHVVVLIREVYRRNPRLVSALIMSLADAIRIGFRRGGQRVDVAFGELLAAYHSVENDWITGRRVGWNTQLSGVQSELGEETVAELSGRLPSEITFMLGAQNERDRTAPVHGEVGTDMSDNEALAVGTNEEAPSIILEVLLEALQLTNPTCVRETIMSLDTYRCWRNYWMTIPKSKSTSMVQLKTFASGASLEIVEAVSRRWWTPLLRN